MVILIPSARRIPLRLILSEEFVSGDTSVGPIADRQIWWRRAKTYAHGRMLLLLTWHFVLVHPLVFAVQAQQDAFS